MSGFTPFGQVLQMQGGSLQQKVGSVFAEKLKIIKSMDGGAPSAATLQKLLGGGGLSAIMMPSSSGIGGLLGGLQQTITSLTSQLGASSPMTTAALGGLSQAATGLAATAAGLAGVGPPTPYGPTDLVLHAGSVASLGADPGAMSLAAAAAPILPAVTPIVAAATTGAQDAVLRLRFNGTDDAGAAAMINVLAANLTAVVTTSSAAIGGLRDVQETLAVAQAIAASTVAGDANAAAMFALIVQPDVLAEMQDIAVEAYSIPPPTIGTLAPLINVASAVMQWIMGTTPRAPPVSPQDVP